MEQRLLGKTGLQVSILGLGGYPLSLVDERQAIQVVNECLDQGVTYLDTASSYGDSEEKIGKVMRTRRREVVLATKTLERTRGAANQEIRRSMERLQTDLLDVLQIHAVNSMEILDQVTGPGGSLEAALEFQRAGAVRFIGVTGHRRPEVLVEALRRFEFATVLFPHSLADASLLDFLAQVGPEAQKRGTGMIAMKVLAQGKVRDVSVALRYVWSAPITTAIVGMQSPREVRENAELAEAFAPLDREEAQALVAAHAPLATTRVLWWKA